ncbi:hypothetical protein evm_014314 [Chilo suppressalis]|nr:hypothetical protein evm_014314 [Chilo suppressalis]
MRYAYPAPVERRGYVGLLLPPNLAYPPSRTTWLGGCSGRGGALPTKNPTVLARLPKRVLWDPDDAPRYPGSNSSSSWCEELYSHGPSFSTIAGAGENGAIIHYSPPREGSRVIGKYDMLLVDSGGQYKDGTTDITRTRHMNASPTQAQRLAFTRVLKGQIMLGTVVFPKWTVVCIIV